MSRTVPRRRRSPDPRRAPGRCLAREYDHRLDTSASRVYWASIANMARRLTTPAPTWRDTLGLAA
nr:hypothetical protein [Streptomyces sp. WAC00263]